MKILLLTPRKPRGTLKGYLGFRKRVLGRLQKHGIEVIDDMWTVYYEETPEKLSKKDLSSLLEKYVRAIPDVDAVFFYGYFTVLDVLYSCLARIADVFSVEVFRSMNTLLYRNQKSKEREKTK